MFILIESTVGGNVAGYLQCTINENETVKSLIDTFCESKKISSGPNFALRDQKGILLDSKRTLSACQIKNGDTLYLENQGWQSGNMFHFTNWWLLACVAVLISLGGFAVALSLHLLTGPTPIQYGIVLDGGSSHTALFVYQWPGPKLNGTGVLSQIGECESHGDIGSFYNNISGIDAFLTPCLTYASKIVPPTSHSTTPLYFGATAGLRLLNMSNPSATNVLLDGIRNRLIRSGFKFQDSYVAILSGSEEAQFSWVTVNFLLEKLGANNENTTRKELRQSVGALDLGGASTQMSFEPIDGQEVVVHSTGSSREHGTNDLQLYGSNYSVYTESMLCYGVAEVVKRYYSMLIVGSDPETSDVILSPCHPIGYSEVVSASRIFSSPCAQKLSSPSSSGNWTFNGTSSHEQCSSFIKRLFNITFCQSNFINDTCFYSSAQSFNNQNNFVAFSSFKSVTTDLNITKNSSLEDFQKTVKLVCSSSFSQLPPIGPSGAYTPLLCLESEYTLSLLTDGYGVNSSSWEKIVFSEHVGEAELGWSLGYMIDKTNSVPAVVSSALLSTAAFTALTILFGLFLIVGCLLSYHAIRMKRCDHSYNRTLVLRMDDEMERFLPAESTR